MGRAVLNNLHADIEAFAWSDEVVKLISIGYEIVKNDGNKGKMYYAYVDYDGRVEVKP